MLYFIKRITGLGGIFLLVLLLLISPGLLLAAEVLQVSNSTLIRIGDHNRTYTVKLACIEIDPENEIKARNWLKEELPRRKRVNFRPTGIEDGVLLAKVTPLGEELDLTAGLVSSGLGRLTC